ncbi:dynamin family protein [Pedococcus sp. NPDC057267]|uniref:dynamin family protein n=1 Tax=Pedococcus sp. NPDC057267 TaxID=3346077 RepID=UPI003641FEA1
MSPLIMGGARVKGITAKELAQKSAALEQALAAGNGQLDPRRSAEARDLVAKVAGRTSKAGGHTVVALAGATGSGKSSLFNALVGEDVAMVGARRPTTSRPVAAVWGEEDAGELLDWLGVQHRHRVGPDDGAELDGDLGAEELTVAGARDRHEARLGNGRGGEGRGGDGRGSVGLVRGRVGRRREARPGRLDGLVLLDLPDFDSRVLAHREESERVLKLVDVFVWVTDPQKYADARLHDDYLKVLATYDAVTVAVLNQTDRLTPDAVGQVRSDLSRLAADDGIAQLQVLATSARTGEGVEALRMRLATAVAAQNAAQHRLAADIRASASALRAGLGVNEPQLSAQVDDELVDALARAAGIPVVVNAVERDYRHQAYGRTGWPFTRWLRALRPDPMKRLRLNTRDEVEEKLAVTAGDVRTVLGRSSLPPPTPAARAAVELATRRVGADAAEGLPHRWAEAVADAATPPGPELADALDLAVVGTSLKMRAPLWWRFCGLAQLVLALLTVVGALWLAVLVVLGWLAVPAVDTPRVGSVPVPLLLLVGGLVLGLALSAAARWFAVIGARRRAERIRRRLLEAVAAVAESRIMAPVREVLARHKTTREALDLAAV